MPLWNSRFAHFWFVFLSSTFISLRYSVNMVNSFLRQLGWSIWLIVYTGRFIGGSSFVWNSIRVRFLCLLSMGAFAQYMKWLPLLIDCNSWHYLSRSGCSNTCCSNGQAWIWCSISNLGRQNVHCSTLFPLNPSRKFFICIFMTARKSIAFSSAAISTNLLYVLFHSVSPSFDSRVLSYNLIDFHEHLSQ